MVHNFIVLMKYFLSFLKAQCHSKVTGSVVVDVTGANWKICNAFIYDAIDVEISHFTILDVFALMCFEVQNDNIMLQSRKERLIVLILSVLTFVLSWLHKPFEISINREKITLARRYVCNCHLVA